MYGARFALNITDVTGTVFDVMIVGETRAANGLPNSARQPRKTGGDALARRVDVERADCARKWRAGPRTKYTHLWINENRARPAA